MGLLVRRSRRRLRTGKRRRGKREGGGVGLKKMVGERKSNDGSRTCIWKLDEDLEPLSALSSVSRRE
jgi:hypothetical protein